MKLKKYFPFLITLLINLSPRIVAATTTENIGPQANLYTLDIKPFLFSIANVVLGIIGVVSTVMLLYGIIVKITAGGNEDSETHSRKLLIGAVIGMFLVIVSWTLFSTVFKNVVQAAG
ncbi:MAG: hypothetical protein WCT08_04470 [Patescibacteria group bacterium]|jgi:hypothetical protein